MYAPPCIHNNNEHVATSLLSRMKKWKNDSCNKDLVSKCFLVVFAFSSIRRFRVEYDHLGNPTLVIKNSYFPAKLVSACCVLKELVHGLAVRKLSSGCTWVTHGCGSSNSFASLMLSKHLTCIHSFKHGPTLYFM